MIIIFITGYFGANAQTLYSAPDQSFSIQFPGKPAYSSQVIENENGDIEMHSASYEKGEKEMYMVSWSDYPATIIAQTEAQDLLNGGMMGTLNGLGIQQPKLKETRTIQGFPALYFEAEKNNSIEVSYLLVLVNNRIYQVAIMAEKRRVDEKDRKSYFDSFKVKL